MTDRPWPPLWKRVLFWTAILIGMPLVAGRAADRAFGSMWLIVAGIVLAVAASFSTRQCPACRRRLFTISRDVERCPSCGAAYPPIPPGHSPLR